MNITRLALFSAVVCMTFSSAAIAQPPGRGPGGGFGGGPGRGGELGLLFDERVREELEIVDSQVEELRGLMDGMRNKMREMFSGLRDLSQEEREAKFAELREKAASAREEIQEQVNGVLLDHQVERLKQIAFQRQLQGGVDGFTSDRVGEALNITEAQREKLEGMREELEAEYREKLAKIREELREKVLSVLDSSQRAKLEELTGEPFDFGRGQGGPQGRPGQGRPGGGGPAQGGRRPGGPGGQRDGQRRAS